MRVAVISTPVFPCPPIGYSGLEAIAWSKAKGLAAKGHKVTLIAPEGSWCPGVEVLSCGVPPGQWDEKSFYSKYWQELPKFDAIIDESWAKWSYTLKMEGKLKAPILGVCHAPVSTMFQTLPEVEHPCFVCISQDQAAHFQGLFSRSARVAYNGIDLDQYKPLGIPRSNRFLFLARFSSVKSPDVCQDACIAADVGLDLIGDTSITNEPDYFAKCQAKCDGKKIRMIGSQPRGGCVWWFSQARGLLHLTRNFREPFGLAPVESQACGAGVLAWDNGALRETVKHGETGFLVNSLQGAIDVLKSGAMDGLDREKCREWASQYSVQNMVNRYEALCLEAMEGGW